MEQEPVEITMIPATQASQPTQHQPGSSRFRWAFLLAVVVLAVIFVVGLRWVFQVNPEGAPFLIFSYAVGLTMIFLPCTLPLAFVIVPLAMGKSVKKGFAIAIAFGIGVTITLSLYGGILGFIGSWLIGTLAPGASITSTQAVAQIARFETVKNILYAIAGILGLIFALGEIGLIRFRMPTYTGALPARVQRQSDILKSFLLGLLMGNIGVGCPNPLFNAVIVPKILITASITQGIWVMFIHALGRITPLLMLAFLAVLGVNATRYLIKHQESVEKGTGWAMVIVAGFIISFGVFGHDWYVHSGIHSLSEVITQEEFITTLLGKNIGQLGHAHDIPPAGKSLAYGDWLMLLIWIIPLIWWYWREKRKAQDLPTQAEEEARKGQLKFFKWFIAAFAAFALVTFVFILPHMFQYHWSSEATEHTRPDNFYMSMLIPDPLEAGKEAPLTFVIKTKDKSGPLPLQVNHERLAHIIIMKEDFTHFSHVHPEDFGDIAPEQQKGEYTIRYTFPQGGKYLIGLNTGYNNQEISKQFIVEVEPRPSFTSIRIDLSKEKNFDGYDVRLKTPDVIRAGELTDIRYIFFKDRNPVTDLEPYLGAAMHFAIVSIDLSSFDHVHGEVKIPSSSPAAFQSWQEEMGGIINGAFAHDTSPGTTMNMQMQNMQMQNMQMHTPPALFGPDVFVLYIFPHPGWYQLYGEAKHQGKVITTSFMVEVAAGSNTPVASHVH